MATDIEKHPKLFHLSSTLPSFPRIRSWLVYQQPESFHGAKFCVQVWPPVYRARRSVDLRDATAGYTFLCNNVAQVPQVSQSYFRRVFFVG